MNTVLKIIRKSKLEYIFNKVKESGTKNSTEQFIYVVEEIGEIAEVLRCLNNDIRKKGKTKKDLAMDLAMEIGDTLITLYLTARFEGLDFFEILRSAIEKEYNRWSNDNTKLLYKSQELELELNRLKEE